MLLIVGNLNDNEDSKSTSKLCPQCGQYIFLYPLLAAHALTVAVLKKADRALYRQRRTMEDTFGMPHGTFSGAKMRNYPRALS